MGKFLLKKEINFFLRSPETLNFVGGGLKALVLKNIWNDIIKNLAY